MPPTWLATRTHLQAAPYWVTACRVAHQAVPEAPTPTAAWQALLAGAPDDPFWLAGITWHAQSRLVWSTTPVVSAGWGAQALVRVPGLARAWATAHTAVPTDRDRPLLWLLPHAAAMSVGAHATRGPVSRGIFLALREWQSAGWLDADAPAIRLLHAYFRQVPDAAALVPNPVPYEPGLFNRFHPLAQWIVRRSGVTAERLVTLIARNPTFSPLALDAPAADASVIAAAIQEAGGALGQQPSVVAALLRHPVVRAAPPAALQALWGTHPDLLSSLVTHLLVESPGTAATAAALAWLVTQHGAPAVATAARVSAWTQALRPLTARGAWIRAQLGTPGFVDLWAEGSARDRVTLLTGLAPARRATPRARRG